MPLFYALESGIVIDIRNKKTSYIERKGKKICIEFTESTEIAKATFFTEFLLVVQEPKKERAL